MLEHPDLLNAHLVELADQAARAKAEHVDVSRQPRVRRIVTDVAKGRRMRRLEREADAIVRSGRKEKQSRGA